MDYYYPVRHSQLLAVNLDYVLLRRISRDLFPAKYGIEAFLIKVMKSDLVAVLQKRFHRCPGNGVIEASRMRVGKDYRDFHIAFFFPQEIDNFSYLMVASED
jgi:hypothetical protein